MTPAPWSISNGPVFHHASGDVSGFMVSHDDGHVALVFSLEDARAVAALPELVEALDWLVASVEAGPKNARQRRDHEDRLLLACACARGALSKLEGKA